MKKFALTLFLGLVFASCEKQEMEENCQCNMQGIIYISTNNGQDWNYAGMDERSGMKLPCYMDKKETNQSYGSGPWKKTVWNCITND